MKKLFFFLLLLLLFGCETTGDPRQGGLFGWNEGKAQQRQGSLRGTLSEEEDAGRRDKAASGELERERQARTAEEASLRSDLATLDADLNRIQQQIQSAEAGTVQQQRKKQKAQQELARLKKQKGQIQKSSLAVQQKKEKIEMLNREIESLLQMVSNL